MFATIPSVMPQIAAGTVRAIAVSSVKRSRSLPDVPTVADSGFPGFEADSWFGYFGPRSTPPEVIATLNNAVNEIIATPATEAQLIKEAPTPPAARPSNSPASCGASTRSGGSSSASRAPPRSDARLN